MFENEIEKEHITEHTPETVRSRLALLVHAPTNFAGTKHTALLGEQRITFNPSNRGILNRSWNNINQFQLSLPRNLVASFTGSNFLWKLRKGENILLCVTLVTSQRYCIHCPRNTESADAKKKAQRRSPSSNDASNWHAWSCVFFALFCIVRVCVEPSSLDAMFLVAKHNLTTPELSQ